MTLRQSILWFLTALTIGGAVNTPAAAPSSTEYLAIWRGDNEVALIDSGGQIVFFDGTRRVVKLTLRNRPLSWRHLPTSFIRWNSEWVVADGTNELRRFDSRGKYLASIRTPVPVSDMALAGKTLWCANFLARNAAARLWRSDDLTRFTSFAMKDPSDDPLAAILRSQMVLAGAASGELYVAHLIDAPIVHRVWPVSKAHSWPLAYSRSSRRAALERAEEGIEDLTQYSSPVRDMIATRSGDLLVLRNREDMRTAEGLSVQQGLRADRYRSNGQHVATAQFPHPVKWLLRWDADLIAGITRAGTVHTAKWNKPAPGGLVR